METITAPFTSAQVQRLNEVQGGLTSFVAIFHPFTCRHRSENGHGLETGGQGILIATKSGWNCPCCGYTQEWAYDAMVSMESNSFDDITRLSNERSCLITRTKDRIEEYLNLYRNYCSIEPTMSAHQIAQKHKGRNVIAVMIGALRNRYLSFFDVTVVENEVKVGVSWNDNKISRPHSSREVQILLQHQGVLNPLHDGFGPNAWVLNSSFISDAKCFSIELCQGGRATHWREIE